MSTRTANTKGLARPHKAEAARPGIGSSLSNARSIATERSPKGKPSKGGLPGTFFGNSRSIDTARGRK